MLFFVLVHMANAIDQALYRTEESASERRFPRKDLGHEKAERLCHRQNGEAIDRKLQKAIDCHVSPCRKHALPVARARLKSLDFISVVSSGQNFSGFSRAYIKYTSRDNVISPLKRYSRFMLISSKPAHKKRRTKAIGQKTTESQ